MSVNKTPKFIIDCADHTGFVRLANGQKNILTRANRSSALHEDYSLSRPRDILRLVDNKTSDSILVSIIEVHTYNSLEEVFLHSDIPMETFGKKFANVQEFEQEYEKNRPGYSSVIDKNGLVVWRVKLLKY